MAGGGARQADPAHGGGPAPPAPSSCARGPSRNGTKTWGFWRKRGSNSNGAKNVAKDQASPQCCCSEPLPYDAGRWLAATAQKPTVRAPERGAEAPLTVGFYANAGMGGTQPGLGTRQIRVKIHAKPWRRPG